MPTLPLCINYYCKPAGVLNRHPCLWPTTYVAESLRFSVRVSLRDTRRQLRGLTVATSPVISFPHIKENQKVKIFTVFTVPLAGNKKKSFLIFIFQNFKFKK